MRIHVQIWFPSIRQPENIFKSAHVNPPWFTENKRIFIYSFVVVHIPLLCKNWHFGLEKTMHNNNHNYSYYYCRMSNYILNWDECYSFVESIQIEFTYFSRVVIKYIFKYVVECGMWKGTICIWNIQTFQPKIVICNHFLQLNTKFIVYVRVDLWICQ